ncbi:hypothetical protein C0995_002260 [Termitomyces sp. Mi166|nr:hypothetical protein C0995_002260 [Termitomyces sp. Mi166\
MASTPINLTPTLGVYEIGVLISMFLFGLVTVQTFTYYKLELYGENNRKPSKVHE